MSRSVAYPCSQVSFTTSNNASMLARTILHIVENQDHVQKEVKMSNDDRGSEVRASQSKPEREQRIFTFKASQWIWLLLYIVEVLIALRIGLKLMGANPDSPIVVLIYGFTSLFLIPFVRLVDSQTRGGRSWKYLPYMQWEYML